MRGALAVCSRLPAYDMGTGLAARRGHRQADGRGQGDDPVGIDVGDSAVARDRQHAVSCYGFHGGLRGAAVRTAPARYPYRGAAVAGAAVALRVGRTDPAW